MSDTPEPAETEGSFQSEQATRAARNSVMLSAVVERFGGFRQTKHRVRDLSTGGVRIDQAADFRIGSTVLVSVGLLEAVGATVVWVHNSSAGLRFAKGIDPDDARAKAAIVPRGFKARARKATEAIPTAGWIQDTRDCYRG